MRWLFDSPVRGGEKEAMSGALGPMDLYPVYDPMVACRTLDGEAVVVHSRTRRLHVLDTVGTFLWEAFSQGNRTVAEVVDALVKEFEVDQATAERDTQQFLEELSREKLVRLQEKPAA